MIMSTVGDGLRRRAEEAQFIGGKAVQDLGGLLNYVPIQFAEWPTNDPECIPNLIKRIGAVLP